MKQMALIVFCVASLTASLGLAHTRLSASIPEDAAVTGTPPEEIVLEFSADVRLTALEIQEQSGSATDLGPIPADTQRRFVVAIPEDLAPGDYLVAWRAIGADTHPVSGEFHFTVSGPAALTSHLSPAP